VSAPQGRGSPPSIAGAEGEEERYLYMASCVSKIVHQSSTYTCSTCCCSNSSVAGTGPPPTLAEGVPERATARLRLATNRLARLSTERRLIIAAPP